MARVTGGFTQFCCNGRSECAHGIESVKKWKFRIKRNVHGVASSHKYSHGFANGTPYAKQHGGQQAVLCGWQEHLVNHLPASYSKTNPGFAVRVWYSLKRVFPDRYDDGNTH